MHLSSSPSYVPIKTVHESFKGIWTVWDNIISVRDPRAVRFTKSLHRRIRSFLLQLQTLFFLVTRRQTEGISRINLFFMFRLLYMHSNIHIWHETSVWHDCRTRKRNEEMHFVAHRKFALSSTSMITKWKCGDDDDSLSLDIHKGHSVIAYDNLVTKSKRTPAAHTAPQKNPMSFRMNIKSPTESPVLGCLPQNSKMNLYLI